LERGCVALGPERISALRRREAMVWAFCAGTGWVLAEAVESFGVCDLALAWLEGVGWVLAAGWAAASGPPELVEVVAQPVRLIEATTAAARVARKARMTPPALRMPAHP
jgi:hypothetical protein